MHVTRFIEAPPYSAAGHDEMQMVRLQGREAGPSDTVWIGVSTIAPGGGTTLDSSSIEKFYVVLQGEVTVSNGRDEIRLGQWDSCRIAPDEGRQLRNNTEQPASILLVMPLQASRAI
jgi:quercetin dioxygenase-like cupin family protein